MSEPGPMDHEPGDERSSTVEVDSQTLAESATASMRLPSLEFGLEADVETEVEAPGELSLPDSSIISAEFARVDQVERAARVLQRAVTAELLTNDTLDDLRRWTAAAPESDPVTLLVDHGVLEPQQVSQLEMPAPRTSAADFDALVVEAVILGLLEPEAVTLISELTAAHPGTEPTVLLVEHGLLEPLQIAELRLRLQAPPEPAAPAVAKVGVDETAPTRALGLEPEAEAGGLGKTRILPDDTAAVPPVDLDDLRQLGSFALGEKLGEGGFGTVYRAEQIGIGRQVAVKVLTPSVARKRSVLERFQLEARTLGLLDHPNLVRVIDVGEQDGNHYYAMDLLAGRELRDLLPHDRPSQRESAEIILGASRGLAEAHARGIVHRDIKPENILLVEDEDGRRPVVIDFGLAVPRDVDRMTQDGMLVGTPTYMGPEQFVSGGELSPSCDVYALGVTLYELLAGEPPHVASTIQHLMFLKVEGRPQLLLTKAEGISPDLAAIVHKAIEEEPEDRYVDAREMAEDLERFLAGKPVKARPVSRLREWVMWARRKPLVASLVAIVALGGPTALAVAGVLAWRTQQAESSADQAARERDKARQRTADATAAARRKQLELRLGRIDDTLAQLASGLDPKDDAFDPRGTRLRAEGALERLSDLALSGVSPDQLAGGAPTRRQRLERAWAEAVALAGMSKAYDRAVETLRAVGIDEPGGKRAAVLRALIGLETMGLPRLIWRQGLKPLRGKELARLEMAAYPEPGAPALTGQRADQAMALVRLLDPVVQKYPEAKVERVRLLLFLGKPRQAGIEIDAMDLSSWRERHKERYYRAIQGQLLTFHAIGTEAATEQADLLIDELRRDVRDISVAATSLDVAPAMVTACRLLLERYMSAPETERPILFGSLAVARAELEDRLIANPAMSASQRFPSLRWTVGLIRLAMGDTPAEVRPELLRALAAGYQPRADSRLGTLPAWKWILTDKVLITQR